MANPKRYSEDKYLRAFKRVCNRLRKFLALEIIVVAITRLHSSQLYDIEVFRQQPPWFLLLLIKWAIVYGDFREAKKRQLTGREFNKIVNLMHHVDGSLRPPSAYHNPRMFLRAMAYQQFWHQESPSRSEISRQSILFGHLDVSHRFRTWFIQHTGIDIDKWIDLSFMLLSGLLPADRHWISTSYFEPVHKVHSSEEIQRFLKSVSKTPSELRQHLRELHEEEGRDSSEFREKSPLVRFPLIILNEKHYYYSIPLLLHSLGNFTYDTLRTKDAQKFMDAFGSIFESYVERGVAYLGEPYLTESAIRKIVGNSKTVDFAILGENANMLFDAKGVEMMHGGNDVSS